MESLFSLHIDYFVLETILLFGCKARKKWLLEANLNEMPTVLHEQARFIREYLFFVHSDKRASSRPTVSYVKTAVLHMNIAMRRTHSHSFYRQVWCLFVISKVEPVIQINFNENCNLKLILIQGVSLKDKIRIVIIE